MPEGPYDYLDRGINPNKIRSESTENEIMRRQLPMYPPVTILQDFMGRIDPALGQQNALVDAIRKRILYKMLETGSPAIDNYGAAQNYGKPKE